MEKHRSVMPCATCTFAKAMACTSMMPDGHIAAVCRFFVLSCLYGSIYMQVPEYVRLCLHDVAEVRPLSLNSLHACEYMFKSSCLTSMTSALTCMSCKPSGREISWTCLVHSTGLKPSRIWPSCCGAAKFEALQHLLVADQIHAKRSQRWGQTGC